VRSLYFDQINEFGNFNRLCLRAWLDDFECFELKDIRLWAIGRHLIKFDELLRGFTRVDKVRRGGIGKLRHLQNFLGLLFNQFQTAKFVGEINDLLGFVGRFVTARAQNTCDAVDNLIVGFALQTFVLSLRVRSCGLGVSLRSLIVSDNLPNGAEHFLHRRLIRGIDASMYRERDGLRFS
jgi:hypothetical protein